MKSFLLFDDYEKMSAAAAEKIVSAIRENPRAVLVLATGHSPLLAYRMAAERILREKLDLSGVTFVKLDEWTGLSREDGATCEVFLKKEFLGPLGVGEENFLHFDPEAKDPAAECRRVAGAYEALPDPDLVILGIGRNGHLGLNEPGAALSLSAHPASLEKTTLGHEMLRHASGAVSGGMTLGVGELFRGKTLLLLADGEGKEKGLLYLRNDLLDTACPVSLLKLHPGLEVFVNKKSFGL